MVCSSRRSRRRASQAPHSSHPCSGLRRRSSATPQAERTDKRALGKRRGRKRQAEAMGSFLRYSYMWSIVKSYWRFIIVWHIGIGESRYLGITMGRIAWTWALSLFSSLEVQKLRTREWFVYFYQIAGQYGLIFEETTRTELTAPDWLMSKTSIRHVKELNTRNYRAL